MISNLSNNKNIHNKNIDKFPTLDASNLDFAFVDLIEIEEPEQIEINRSNVTNNIELAKYIQPDNFSPHTPSVIEMEESKKIKKTNNEKNINKYSHKDKLQNVIQLDDVKEQDEYKEDTKKSKNIEGLSTIEELSTVDDIEQLTAPEDTNEVEELEELDDVEELEALDEKEDDVSMLIKKIDEEHDDIEYPGKINLTQIDNNLSNQKLENCKKKEKKEKSEKKFGVNRVEVFYNIDKQIYSSRSAGVFSKSKMKNIKKGLFLPAIVAISSFFLLLIVAILVSVYFKSISTATLEDNVIEDKSILAKIVKQKEEEARLAGLKLDQERKKLEHERSRMENTINEELLKKEAEIENKYKQKMKKLGKKDISKEEIEKLKKEYEMEKNKALELAKEQKIKKTEEQSKIIAKKNKKIKTAMNNLKKESESYESELAKIRKEFEQRSEEEAKKIELANKRLKEIKDIEGKIKNFNSTVYQLISGSMSEFKNAKYDSALEKLNAVLKYYNSRLEFVAKNDELKNKMDTDIFFVETIKNLIEKSRSSVGYNKEYTKIINKFEKATNCYKKAEAYYNEKNYTKSGKEYAKVLEEFEEINFSYEKIKDIEKQTQNIKAFEYYNQALNNIKDKKYNIALSQLSAVIKEAPMSDYTNQALSKIVKITDTVSYTGKISDANEKAKRLFSKAENLEKRNLYDESIQLYQQIITDYSFSDYTKKALEKSKAISRILNQQGFEKYDKELKGKFDSDFKKYQDYYKKGDIENARRYYFDALRNAFDIYTNNSIADFKEEEDKYIELLLQDSTIKSDEYLKTKLEEAQKELTVKYELELENQKKSLEGLEKDKKILNDKYDTLLKKMEDSSTLQRRELIKKYEEELETKNKEIEKYKNYIEEKEKKISEEEQERILKEYEEKLKNEKEKSETLKKQLFEYYKKESDLLLEKEKSNKLEKRLNDLQDKYTELEKKYNKKTLSEKEKEKIEQEYEEIFKEKYELEKEKEINLERQKVRNEFEEELEKMKKYIVALKLNIKEEDIIRNKEYKDQLFGRITDIINESVAFQFIALDPNTKIKINKGEKVQIIRLIKEEGIRKEIVIGYMEVTSISAGSLYGRGRMISIKTGYSIRVADLLKN